MFAFHKKYPRKPTMIFSNGFALSIAKPTMKLITMPSPGHSAVRKKLSRLVIASSKNKHMRKS